MIGMGMETAENPARYFIGFSLRNAVTLCFYVQCLGENDRLHKKWLAYDGLTMFISTHGWFKNVMVSG